MCSCNQNRNSFSSMGTSEIVKATPLNVMYSTVEAKKTMVCDEVQCGMRYSDVLELSKASSAKYKETKDVKFLTINAYFSHLMNRMVSDSECKVICEEIEKINSYAGVL